MIQLTRLNQRPVAVNCDLIEWVEAHPDTTVRMVSGESLLVLESVEEVIRRIVDYRRSLFHPSAGQGARTVATLLKHPSTIRRAGNEER